MDAPYAWIITADHLMGEGAPTAVGTCGPSAVGPATHDRLLAGEGTPFRLLDDDGELYYEGLLIGDSKGDAGLGPLDDFGAPNAGCTSIEYKNEAGEWEAL